jgi:hypothetical protein
MLNQISCLMSVLAAAGLRLLTGLHVVFVGRVIAALVSLVSLVYILAALLTRLIGAFVAAGIRHVWFSLAGERFQRPPSRWTRGGREKLLDFGGRECGFFVIFVC